MVKIISRTKKRNEQGMALLLSLFALLLLSGIGLCMVLASTTETRIDANYSGSLRSITQLAPVWKKYATG